MAIVETKPLAQQQQGEKYTPNLSGFISQCERNYVQLQRLMTMGDEEHCWQFNIQDTHLSTQLIEISIVERCTYTTSLKIKQLLQGKVISKDQQDGNNTVVSEPEMYVRLYHDAKMAEVLSYQSVGKIKPSYTYPNKKMHQKNEKSQWNTFLGEWLAYCIKTGYSTNAFSFR